MLRKITLTLLMLASIGAMFPLDESTAHGIRQAAMSTKRNHYRRHSRAWWRRYRARQRRRRAAALAHRRALLAAKIPQPAVATSPNMTPKLPTGWNNMSKANSPEMKFSTGADTASVPGQATLAVVAQSRPIPSYLTTREQSRMLAGFALTDLRRIVIDKMIAAGGWVTNDYQRDVAGSRVFVVTAQTPSDAYGPEKSWNFYFTELNGRVYSLTTNTPRQFSDRMAAEAEEFIASLQAGSNSAAATTQR